MSFSSYGSSSPKNIVEKQIAAQQEQAKKIGGNEGLVMFQEEAKQAFVDIHGKLKNASTEHEALNFLGDLSNALQKVEAAYDVDTIMVDNQAAIDGISQVADITSVVSGLPAKADKNILTQRVITSYAQRQANTWINLTAPKSLADQLTELRNSDPNFQGSEVEKQFVAEAQKRVQAEFNNIKAQLDAKAITTKDVLAIINNPNTNIELQRLLRVEFGITDLQKLEEKFSNKANVISFNYSTGTYGSYEAEIKNEINGTKDSNVTQEDHKARLVDFYARKLSEVWLVSGTDLNTFIQNRRSADPTFKGSDAEKQLLTIGDNILTEKANKLFEEHKSGLWTDAQLASELSSAPVEVRKKFEKLHPELSIKGQIGRQQVEDMFDATALGNVLDGAGNIKLNEYRDKLHNFALSSGLSAQEKKALNIEMKRFERRALLARQNLAIEKNITSNELLNAQWELQKAEFSQKLEYIMRIAPWVALPLLISVGGGASIGAAIGGLTNVSAISVGLGIFGGVAGVGAGSLFAVSGGALAASMVDGKLPFSLGYGRQYREKVVEAQKALLAYNAKQEKLLDNDQNFNNNELNMKVAAANMMAEFIALQTGVKDSKPIAEYIQRELKIEDLINFTKKVQAVTGTLYKPSETKKP